jgi:N-acyl-D-aspartate/D-glutamate deacylase
MPIVFMQTMRKPFKFSEFENWRPALNGTADEQRRLYADPEFRARAKAEQVGHIRKIPWERVRVAGAVRPDLAARYNDRTIGMIAEVEHKHPLDAFLDLTLEDDLRTLYQFESANLDRDVVRTLLQEPRFMLGISDAGAHVDQVCDLRYPTVLLGDWVRESGALTLEFAVWKLTGHPASVFGIADRGRLAPGMAADLVAFDPGTVGVAPLERVHDLPAGADRLVARSRGIHHVWVNGTPIVSDGADVPAQPGKVLR